MTCLRTHEETQLSREPLTPCTSNISWT